MPHGTGRRDSGSVLERAFTDAAGGALPEPGQEELLDAAYDLFCHQGIHRTTMEDVARRAGLSRITVYRRAGSKEALVEQVVLREFRRYFDQFQQDLRDAETVADRVVVGFVSSLRAIRGNPLIAGVLRAEGDVSTAAVLGAHGRTLALVRGFLAGQLRREQSAGTVATDLDVDVVAELMVRLSASFLLAPSDVVDLDDENQLADLARRFLAPMLTPGV